MAELAIVEMPPTGAFIPAVIELGVERAGGSLTAFAAGAGVALSTASLWRAGRRQPSIDAILRLCRISGFAVADFLFDRIDALRASRRPDVQPWLPRRTSVYRDIDWPGFRRALGRAVRDPACPAPTAIARQWNVDVEQARRTLPELWARLSTRSTERRHDEAAARLAERRRLVVDTVRSIHDEGRYPSKHQVSKRSPTVNFRDPRILGTWADELARLGYRRAGRELAA